MLNGLGFTFNDPEADCADDDAADDYTCTYQGIVHNGYDIGTKPKTVIADLAYRGVDRYLVPVQVIHRGKAKSLTPQQKIWLRRRQAIEPAIGHTKADHRMGRCWLKGAEREALHAVLCAAGFNIRWLLRAIAKRGLAALLLVLTSVVVYAWRLSLTPPQQATEPVQ